MGLFDGLPVFPDKGYLREDLSQIDESWVAARFDSLAHVVHILTSKDREGEVRFLKEQSDIVEEVVDEVLWYRSVTLRHIISLLDQIEGIAKVPARIEKLIAEKQFYAAVQLHVQSTLMLEREGLQTVRALQDVRSELTKLRGVLFYKILDELYAHLYNKGEYSSSINENDDEVPTTTAVALSMNNSQPLSRRTRLLKGDNQFGVHGDGLYRPSSIDGGDSSFDGHDEDGALDAHDEVRVNGGEGYSKEVKIVPRQMPTWLLYSTPNEFLETMQKSDAPLHVKYLQTMVECLCMLGKVAAAGAMICQRLRPTIHEVITSKIKAHAKLVNSSRYGVGQTTRSVIPGLQFMKGHLESYQLPKQKRQNGISLAGTLLAVSPVSHVMAPTGKAQVAAKELLDSILDTVVRIFASQVTGGYSIGFSLTVLQSECQQLICEILRATPEAASADAAVQTARLASKVPSKGKRDGAEDGLTFAFCFTDASISIPNQGWSKKGPIIQEGYGSATLLLKQGIYLAASIYRPVLQFTEKVASMLPMKYSQLGNDGLLAFMLTLEKGLLQKKCYIKFHVLQKASFLVVTLEYKLIWSKSLNYRHEVSMLSVPCLSVVPCFYARVNTREMQSRYRSNSKITIHRKLVKSLQKLISSQKRFNHQIGRNLPFPINKVADQSKRKEHCAPGSHREWNKLPRRWSRWWSQLTDREEVSRKGVREKESLFKSSNFYVFSGIKLLDANPEILWEEKWVEKSLYITCSISHSICRNTNFVAYIQVHTHIRPKLETSLPTIKNYANFMLYNKIKRENYHDVSST
ncbi:hypothetical protein UlMin_008836 [Ulmus minor]